MHPLERTIERTIADNRLLSPTAAVVVAVSAGPDSMALLHLLTAVRPDCRYTAVYVDHNLRPDETERERRLVAACCRDLGIGFVPAFVDAGSETARTGKSPEECARLLRYAALRSAAARVRAEAIAVGHTRDDQVEEILISLIRGTGLAGLAGMSLKTNDIVRPLLGVSKRELRAYLQERDIPFCLDSTNESRRFLRNRVRLDLIPFLERGFNPSMKDTILHTAAVLGDEDRFLACEVDRIYPSVIDSSPGQAGPPGSPRAKVLRSRFRSLHAALRRRVLERLCWTLDCRPHFQLIEDMIGLIDSGKTGSELHLPNRIRMVVTATQARFLQAQGARDSAHAAAHPFDRPIRIEHEGDHVIEPAGRILRIRRIDAVETAPPGLVADRETVRFPLVLRAARSGERFQPLGAPGTKKVSRYLSDKKIPRHLRPYHPVLESQGTIIAIVGLTLTETVRVGRHTSSLLLIAWLRPEEADNT